MNRYGLMSEYLFTDDFIRNLHKNRGEPLLANLKDVSLHHYQQIQISSKTMKRSIRTVAAILLTAFSTITMAQGTKLFTIDDLVPGGATYRNLYPETMYLEWWGDECVQLDMEDCFLIDKNSGKKTTLFTLADINNVVGEGTFQHLYDARFPYSGKTLVLLSTPKERVLVDWNAKKVEWRQPVAANAEGMDWNAVSRNAAFVTDHNLYVAMSDGQIKPVSTDGCHDIVYGESVHRDEFGITKGTFWSPKGDLLAFYRMDQSMVADYPQVDITTRCASLVPDKYPMAGETSHKVTVGIYNPATEQTVYLDAGDPTDRYFTNIAWSPDEKRVYMIELNRDQNHAQLTAYDVATGKKLGMLFEEKNEKYVEPLTPIRFLPWDSSRFIYRDT